MNSPAGADDGAIVLGAMAGLGGLLSAYRIRVARAGPIVSDRLDSVRGTALLGRYPIEAFYWVAGALGRRLSRTAVSPDALTQTSLWITAACTPLAATGHFEIAGVVLLLGSAFDALDGIVARERRLASDAGALLDSVVDRYGDALGLLGLALFYRASGFALFVVLSALVGSMMVSYVRAKAESVGLSLAGGLMRRPERIAYLAGALIFGPTLSRWLAPRDPSRPATLAVVALVAALSNAAALKLLREARGALRRRAERSPGASTTVDGLESLDHRRRG